MTTILAGDIGGTNTRLRLVEANTINRIEKKLILKTTAEQTYNSQGFSDLVPIIKKFLTGVETETKSKIKVVNACFGIAGPVVNNTSELTNLSWVLSGDRLEKELDVEKVELINDFKAIGYGILGLEAEDLQQIQSAPKDPGAPIAVLGAGTGLGEGFLIPDEKGNYRVFGSEGSHADFPPRSSLEFQLLNYIKEKYNLDRVSVERVVSGQGITVIYEFLRDQNCELESTKLSNIYKTWAEELGKNNKTVDLAQEISLAAHAKSDYLCEQTMKIFMEAYGAEAGNLALKLLPYGGLYLAGGITGKNLDLLTQGDFLQAFRQKGRLSHLLDKIPVYAVVNPNVGLIGAALRALQLGN